MARYIVSDTDLQATLVRLSLGKRVESTGLADVPRAIPELLGRLPQALQAQLKLQVEGGGFERRPTSSCCRFGTSPSDYGPM